MTSSIQRRWLPALVALAAALVAVALPLIGAPAAYADTDTSGLNITATFGSQTNVARPGPITGLQDGNTVTVRVEQTASKVLSAIELRLCKGTANITNVAEFQPDLLANCIDPFGSPAPTRAVYSDAIFKTSPSDTFIQGSLPVSTGTFSGGSPPEAITCGNGTSCDLWIRIATTDGGDNYAHYDLDFLAAPGTPQNVTASPLDGGAFVDWDAASGGADSYEVTLTGGPSPIVQTVPGNTTELTVNDLTNGTAYSVTVKAINSLGTGPASTPVSVTPAAGPPVMGAPVVGDGTVDLAWAFGGAATSYIVTVTPVSPAGAPVEHTTSGTNLTVNGLTNGTLYQATVRAVLSGGGQSAESNIAEFSPNATFLTNTMHVTRPQGALVLTQVCTEATGPLGSAPAYNGGNPANYFTGSTADPLAGQYPYPQDPTTGEPLASYPTDCGVDLGAATFVTTGAGAGQFFRATGEINQLTVVDTRDTDPGWDVSGKVSNFVDGTKSFVGDQLGWAPASSDTAAAAYADGSTYDQTVAAGTTVAPNTTGGLGSLAAGRMLGTAAATQGLGIAKLDADLTLLIPVTARTGNYSATLTLTAL